MGGKNQKDLKDLPFGNFVGLKDSHDISNDFNYSVSTLFQNKDERLTRREQSNSNNFKGDVNTKNSDPESVTFSELEKKINKTKALKELSPKQKASLSKKVGSLFSDKSKIKSRKVSQEKELRSLSPVEGKYKRLMNNTKSSERSGSRNNSNKKSIEHI